MATSSPDHATDPAPARRGSVRIAWAVMALMSVLVASVSSRYVLGIGTVPGIVAANRFFDPWLALHAAAAASALLVGPFQFLASIRARYPGLHSWAGRVYVAACLTGGVAGIWLAIGVSTGAVARYGFLALAIVWLVSTALALRAVLKRDFAGHRRWMIRSFALTLAAVTLRIYLPAALFAGIDLTAAYPAIAWLCWVTNLAAAELYLSSTGSRHA